MAKKKKIIKRTPTRVHSLRCTDEEWEELNKLADVCGISIGRYLVESGLNHHPRQRMTKEDHDALNSLTEAREDLIKVRAALHALSEEEKMQKFHTKSFMQWWVDSVTELIRHWYNIEQNISSPVLTKVKEEQNDNAG